MRTIKWNKKNDCFTVDRETMADLVDWAGNIYRNHSGSYNDEDVLFLKEMLDEVNKELMKYLKNVDKHHKIKLT